MLIRNDRDPITIGIHIIGPFHTVLDREVSSHCAFTMKTLNLIKMMTEKKLHNSYRVHEYSNEGSKTQPQNRYQLLSKIEMGKLYPKNDKKATWDSAMNQKSDAIVIRKLVAIMKNTLQPGDLICHTFPSSIWELIRAFPDYTHIETGIGYPSTCRGVVVKRGDNEVTVNTFKIYESHAYLCFHKGAESGREEFLAKEEKRPRKLIKQNDYDFVIPNYYDTENIPVSIAPAEKIGFLGRLIGSKGMGVLLELAKLGYKIYCAGQGTELPEHENLINIGPLTGLQVFDFLKTLKICLGPTLYIGPFEGALVEARLTGTPVAVRQYGCFAEQVEDGVDGWRCGCLEDYVYAIENAHTLSRDAIAKRARDRYSLDTVSQQYDCAFRKIYGVNHGDDWYGKHKPSLKRKHEPEHETRKSRPKAESAHCVSEQ